jgi:hypothetical protein
MGGIIGEAIEYGLRKRHLPEDMKKPLAALLACFALGANASDITGSGDRTSINNGAGWVNACNKEGGPADVCVAFVSGVFIGAAAEGVRRFGICLPNGGIPYRAMAKVFAYYLRHNPSKMQMNSGSLVMMSLAEEFPCEGPKPNRNYWNN